MLRTLRFSQLRFRREEPPCGGMCAALMFRRFNVPAARRRPTFRRWITPPYDGVRDSFFYFFFFIFYPAPLAQRRSRNDQAATTECATPRFSLLTFFSREKKVSAPLA